jgi:biopolymer transport protein ExbB
MMGRALRVRFAPRSAAFAVGVGVLTAGADGRHPGCAWAEWLAGAAWRAFLEAYRVTPADERVTWGGLAACALLAMWVALERWFRVRRARVVPRAYTGRFHERLIAGKLDRGKALDFCELNPSPAARVVLAAVRRWGRPAADMERGVALARGIEVDRLRRHVGTLRRVAALAPLIGLLGTLMAASRGLRVDGAEWAPAVARSLTTLTAGVGLAILSLVAYDGLSGRVEALAGALDRLGAEAVDAIAMSAPVEPKPSPNPAKIRGESAGRAPAPHAIPRRAEIPLEGAE